MVPRHRAIGADDLMAKGPSERSATRVRQRCGTRFLTPGLGRVLGVPGPVPKWRPTADEDGHYCFAVAL